MRRRFDGNARRKTPPIRKLPAETHQPEFDDLSLRWACPLGPVVATRILTLPLPVNDVGVKLQVASAGRPVHDEALKLIVPV